MLLNRASEEPRRWPERLLDSRPRILPKTSGMSLVSADCDKLVCAASGKATPPANRRQQRIRALDIFDFFGIKNEHGPPLGPRLPLFLLGITQTIITLPTAGRNWIRVRKRHDTAVEPAVGVFQEDLPPCETIFVLDSSWKTASGVASHDRSTVKGGLLVSVTFTNDAVKRC